MSSSDAYDERLRTWQEHFGQGLVVVIGSGLSAAEGLPTMAELSHHLQTKMPSVVGSTLLSAWGSVEALLAGGMGLEQALQAVPQNADLAEQIAPVVAAFIREREDTVIEEVAAGRRILPLSGLLPHITPDQYAAVTIVTPNYDRLIELAAEMAGWGVDTLFTGHYIASIASDAASRSAFLDLRSFAGTRPAPRYREHIRLLKPHGSLDWSQRPGSVGRNLLHTPARPLIITPGTTKYARGYEPPFDRHINAANRAIDAARGFLLVGYGFNDSHLETHLVPALKASRPALLLTYELTAQASKVLAEAPNLTAIVADPPGNPTGCTVVTRSDREQLDGKLLWKLSDFTEEVFG